MPKPKPVKIVVGTATPGLEPKPLTIVGGLPVSAAVTALTPLAGGADLATVIAKVNAIIAAIK